MHQSWLFINQDASQINKRLYASLRGDFWTLPQKKAQFQLLMDSFSLSFVIVRLICLQAADIRHVSAVSGVSYTCTPARLYARLHLFFFSPRCERPSSLNSFRVRCFKTSVVHSTCRTIVATLIRFCLKRLLLLCLCRGRFSHGQDTCIRGIGHRGGREVGERLV